MPERDNGLYVPGDNPTSSKTHIREGISTFLDTVNDTDVQQVLETVLLRPTDTTSVYTDMSTVLLSDILDGDHQDVYFDSPVNALQLDIELLQLNHPDIWFQLLHRASSRDKYVSADLAGAFPLKDPATAKSDISKDISNANFKLFGRSLVYLGLAVCNGDMLPSLLSQRELGRLDLTTDTPNGSFLTGVAVGQHFGTPAASPEQAFARLQELFPPGAHGGSEIPALSLLTQAQAFVTPNKGAPSGISTCPAKDMTRSIFTAYGNILTNGNYKGKLLQAIRNS